MPFGKKVNGQPLKSMVNQFSGGEGIGGEGGGVEVNICNTLLCFRLARLIVESKLRLEFDLFAKQIINKFFHELTLNY